MEGAHDCFDKGAHFYEEVWRILLIIRTPDTVPAIQEAYISLLDICQTLFSLINDEILTDHPKEGRNLLSLLGTSQRPPNWEQPACGVYYNYNGYSFEVCVIRNKLYKYVWSPQDVNGLYDLDTIPTKRSTWPIDLNRNHRARSSHSAYRLARHS